MRRLPPDWRRLAGAGAVGFLLGRRSRRRRREHLLVVLALVAIVAALAWAGWPFVLAGVAVAAVALYVRRDDRRSRALTTAQSIDAMVALSPAGFEAAVGRVLTAAGWSHLRRTGGPGDLGADLLGQDPCGRRVVVQCKRFEPGHRVGSEP